MTETKVYTVQEFAEILKSTPKTIRGLIRSGEIRAVKLGKEYRIPVSEVDRLISLANPEPDTDE